MVILSHLSGAPGFFTLPENTSDVLGSTGVRIFFVLSGFLITTLLLREQEKQGSIHLGKFFTRRVFRILPAFFFFLFILKLASVLGSILLLPGDIAKASLFLIDYCRWDSTSNFVRHIWSLSVEEQFYLIWPAGIWLLGFRRAKWIAVFSLVASPVWRIAVIYLFPGNSLLVFREFDCVSDALAAGCVLALLQISLTNSPTYLAILRSQFMHLVPILVLFAASLNGHPHVYLGIAISAINIGIAFYLHRCIVFPPAFLNLLPLRLIGLMSYSLYLWQQVFCSEHDGMARWPWLAALAATFAVSAFSYYLVESPFIQLAGKLLKRPQAGLSPFYAGLPSTSMKVAAGK